MTAIGHSRIAILATDGFEQSELEFPLTQLKKAGAHVDVISRKDGEITGWDEKDWGAAVKVDRTVDQASIDDYDALVLPGGQINPDVLRTDENAVTFVRAFHDSGKPVAAICHAPWLLIEADVVRGRKATSYHSIRTDMINAGARWEDSESVVDGNLITARNPGDLEVFVAAIVAAIEKTSARQAAE